MPFNIDDIQIFVITHNRKLLVQEMIHSILCSTVCPHKIFVCDNESTDGTEQLLSNYPDKRVQYIKTYGKNGNYKKILELANTAYLAVFHDDDILHPQYLEKCLLLLNNAPKPLSLIGCGYTHFQNIDNLKFKFLTPLANSFFYTDELPIYICGVQSGFASCGYPTVIYQTKYYKQFDHIAAGNIYGKLSDFIVLCEMVKYGPAAILLDNGYFYRTHSQADRFSVSSVITPTIYGNFLRYLDVHSEHFKYLSKDRVLDIAQEYYQYTGHSLDFYTALKREGCVCGGGGGDPIQQGR